MCLPPSPEGFERRKPSSSCAARPIAWCSITSWSEEPACTDPSEAISTHEIGAGKFNQIAGDLYIALMRTAGHPSRIHMRRRAHWPYARWKIWDVSRALTRPCPRSCEGGCGCGGGPGGRDG